MLTKYFDSMSKRDPFDGLWRVGMRRDLTHDIFGGLFEDFPPRTANTISHRIEMNEKEMIASFDLPGVKPGDIEVSAVDQRLTISYTLRGKKHTRNYDINNDYDASATTARVENGVLELRCPMITRTKGKKINIEVK